jgi:L-ascorbate metabolism protein UlaG (beta-lactamase superfamily)
MSPTPEPSETVSGSWRATWLGQAGLRLETGESCLVVDPWVSPHEHRLVPQPPLELVAEGVDWLLVTHEHLDHLDLPFVPVLLDRSPAARVVLPVPVAELVEGLVPSSRLLPVLPGDRVDLDGLELNVVPAFHGLGPEDGYSDGSALGGRARFVGYVVGNERRVYLAGDTIVTDELEQALAPLEVEFAFLPINGRDAERESRGIVGNMDATEAVELALAIGARQLVPIHWDAVAGNTVSPDAAVDAAAGRIDVVVPSHFETFELSGRPLR